MEFQHTVTPSCFNNHQFRPFLILICAGLVVFSPAAQAGQNKAMDAIPLSDQPLMNNSVAAPSRMTDAEIISAPDQKPGNGDHEAHETSFRQNRADQKPAGLAIQLERIGDLDSQQPGGLEKTPIDLKALLVPGTIIHFWASWCRPCAAEFPQLDRFYRTHISQRSGENGIRLITISNDFTAAPAARFVEKLGVSFPVYLDIDQASNLAIVGQRTLPATVMIGADGRIHRLALGKLDWAYPKLPDVLAAIAAPKPDAENIAKHMKQGDD